MELVLARFSKEFHGVYSVVRGRFEQTWAVSRGRQMLATRTLNWISLILIVLSENVTTFNALETVYIQ